MSLSVESKETRENICQKLREDLIKCVQRSDCYLKTDRSVQDCVENHMKELPVICQSINTSLGNCKRALVDKRTRFRGIGNITTLDDLDQQQTQSPSSSTSSKT